MILVIDNYDSFVHNLARYVRELGEETEVVRNDAISLAGCRELSPDGIILSPGPGRPAGAGICLDLIESCPDIPILGVCLGHQCIAEVYGGETVSAQEPMHGRSSVIAHDGAGVFAGLNSPVEAGRYHSLSTSIDNVSTLMVRARAMDGEIMALQHNSLPHHGVQFHPESLLTPDGKEIIQNFLQIVKAHNR